MVITEKEMLKIAKQVHLNIEPHKLQALTEDLSHVIEFTRKIFEVDISKLDDITDNTLENIFREDKVEPYYDREMLLMNAPQQDSGCFLVPKVIE